MSKPDGDGKRRHVDWKGGPRAGRIAEKAHDLAILNARVFDTPGARVGHGPNANAAYLRQESGWRRTLGFLDVTRPSRTVSLSRAVHQASNLARVDAHLCNLVKELHAIRIVVIWQRVT